MGKRDPRIDAYIAKQQDFAKPILEYLRDVVHEGCPDVEETLKWNTPSYMHHGLLCGTAGFKQHVVFGFWKWKLVHGSDAGYREATGSYGKLTSLDDLPPKKELLRLVRKAAEINEKGITQPRDKAKAKKTIPVPADLKRALVKNKAAKATFDAFSPSKQRDYLEWITEAKSDDTRARRLEQAVEWMAEGKARNWKYER
jgi:uncharacterized protein YdeI (YjbR/CyaY-like superfamily)